MFLSNIILDDLENPELPHELDFRFEYFSDDDVFLFVHHGVTLHELLEVCLDSLGSMFYLLEMRDPVELAEVLKDARCFEKHFGVTPLAITESYLTFDYEKLGLFFKQSDSIPFVDCAIVGSRELPPTGKEIENIIKEQELSSNLCSIIHTHDNHFLWLKARSLDLLRILISASLIGFFNHVHPHEYSQVPDKLINLIIAKYHTASLVCHPMEWAEDTSKATGVQVDSDRIQALVETCESHWTSSSLNLPKELLGRGLLISYFFKEEVWVFEEWS